MKPVLKSAKAKKSIFDDNDVILKPQNRFSPGLKQEIEKQLAAWLVEHDYSNYHAGLLAEYLCQLAIDKRIEETSSRAANVLFSDKDKIEQVVFEGKKLAQQLEKEKAIDKTLERLERLDGQGEGNSL